MGCFGCSARGGSSRAAVTGVAAVRSLVARHELALVFPGRARTARGARVSADGCCVSVRTPWRCAARAFIDVDEPTSPPSDRCKPSACLRDGRGARGPDWWVGPPSEPCRGRARVEAASSRDVLAPVAQHVDQRIAYFTRGPQRSSVIAIRPYPATASGKAVHRLRDSDRKAADTALEPRRLLRLHQQMQMIMLNAVLKDPEPRGAGRCQRSADCDEWEVVSEGGNA